MAKRKRPREVYRGILGDAGPASWIQEELKSEAWGKVWDASEGTQVVSVRLQADAIALLDAFALRFNRSRSSMLHRLVCGGLGEAFRALPENERAAMLNAVNVKIPGGGTMSFAELFAAADAVDAACATESAKDEAQRAKQGRGRAARGATGGAGKA